MKVILLIIILVHFFIDHIPSKASRVYTYNLTVNFGYGDHFKHENGKIKGHLMGYNYKETVYLSKRNEEFFAGKNKTYPILAIKNITNIFAVGIVYKKSSFFSNPSIYISRVILTPTYIFNPYLRHILTKSFCSDEFSTKIKSKEERMFGYICKN